MRKAGKVIFFIGLILLVIGTIAGIIMIVQSVKAGNELFDSAAPGSTATVTSEAGEKWLVLGNTSADASCRVEGPDGFAPYQSSTGSSSVTVNGRRLHAQGTFEAPVAGDYVVECNAVMSQIGVVPDGTFGRFGGFLAGGIVALVVSGLLVPVVIIGLIVWLVGRSRDKQPPAPPAPGYPAAGFPPQGGGFPGAGGPQNQGGYPGAGGPPNQGGYPNQGGPGYPNQGGAPQPPNRPA